MAQSGYTPIQLYSSPTPGATPTASNLTSGELAINAADGKLFYKDTAGNTQVIANSAYSSGVAVQGSGTSVVNAGTVQFANSNGVTFGLSGSTITASVAAASASPYNIISAGGNTAGALTTFSSGTVVLAGGNNVTLSQNSNTITFSGANANIISAGGNTAGTLTTFGSGAVVLAGGNNITLSQSSNTITISGASTANSYNIISAGGNTAGVLTTFASSTLILAGGNNVTLSQNSNTITINAGAGGNSLTSYSPWIDNPYKAQTSVLSSLSVLRGPVANTGASTASVALAPLVLTDSLVFQNAAHYARFNSGASATINVTLGASTATTAASVFAATQALTLYHNFYTKNVNTFSLHTSLSWPVSMVFSQAVSRTALSAASFSITETLSYPTSTLSNGYAFSTTSGSATYLLATSASSNTFALGSLLASLAGSAIQVNAFSSAPITLSPNTYWYLVGASANYTTNNSNVFMGSMNNINSVQIRAGKINGVNDAVYNKPGQTIIEYSEYSPLFYGIIGASGTQYGYAFYSTDSSGLASYASTLFSATFATNATSFGLNNDVAAVTFR